MKSVITGGSGFIGKHLTLLLRQLGSEVILLSRADFSFDSPDHLCEKIEGCDQVFNLAGASLDHKWTAEYKEEIYRSRVQTTQKLITAINRLDRKPSLLVSTSAVGYYPSDGAYIESADVSVDTFLGKLCCDWEGEAEKVDSSVRLIITRLGVVLDSEGGAFPKLITLFRLGLGGRISSGNQSFSWIHLQDLLNVYRFIIQQENFEGVINAVAPDIVNNDILTYTLASCLHRKAFLVYPAWLLKMVLGERHVLLTDGQYAFPLKLQNLNFQYDYANLAQAIKNLCLKEKKDEPSFDCY